MVGGNVARSAGRGRVLVLGASGYVGARLVPRLVERGWRVRAAGRSRAKLEGRAWASLPGVELAPVDVMDEEALVQACEGCDAMFYLVHAMMDGEAFAQRDREGARNAARAAARAGVGRIVYLGGLGSEDGKDLSEHLASRREVERELRARPVPVTVLRAGVILGSGSASFEILRYLVERLPVMVVPRWVDTPCQPIAIRNVLGYLVGVLERPEKTRGGTFEMGGPDVITYRRLMAIYQEEAGLPRRLVVHVPVLTPRLSALWIHLVTPAPARLARPLAEGLRNPVVVQDDRLEEIVPQTLLTPRQAVRLAIAVGRRGALESRWTDAGEVPPSSWSQPGDPAWTGGTVLLDERRIVVAEPPSRVWRPLVRIGGSTGWYYGDWLWRARGRIDKLVGGVGLRRGRRDPEALRPGDVLDFWRVVDVEPMRRLTLVAEMRLPGQAVLEFELRRDERGESTEVRQVARFRPRGLMGLAYWYGIYPLHAFVFRGMLQGIASAAARQPGPGQQEPERRDAPRGRSARDV